MINKRIMTKNEDMSLSDLVKMTINQFVGISDELKKINERRILNVY